MNMINYIDYVLSKVKSNEIANLQNLNTSDELMSKVWADYVDFDSRKTTEVPFLNKIIKSKSARIFDSSYGDGATSIGLAVEGYSNITGNEVNTQLISDSKKLARKYNIHINKPNTNSIKTYSYNWLELDKQNQLHGKFDALLNLGNSITYIFGKDDQLTVLKNFYDLLNPKGILIIDERNYAPLINGTIHATKDKRNRWQSEIVYPGSKDKTTLETIYESDDLIIFELSHKDNNEKFHFPVYPFKKGELLNLLNETGFKQIDIYGDYKKDNFAEDVNFFTYVCKK